MRIIWRSRISYQLMLNNCLVRGLAHAILCIKLCRYHGYVLLTMLLLLLLWWNATDMNDCGAQDLVERVCTEFHSREAAGNLCKNLCDTKEIKPGLCYHSEHGIQNFRYQGLVTKLSSNYKTSWVKGALEEGLSTESFVHSVKRHIERELGLANGAGLMARLLKHADVNSDDQINLGEAQNIWRLIHQPFFLVFYLFQDLSVFPYLNGTCGGLSMWDYSPYLAVGAKPLFDRHGRSWGLGFFSNNSYRWSLPVWAKRAKVMMGLLELISEFYDRDGGQFHLCNMNGLTLSHTKNFELSLTESSLPLSGAQIAQALRNVSCHSWRDCTLTRQCRTRCDYVSQTCSPRLVRPTLAHACDVMADYLVFDAPVRLKPRLKRLLRRCQNLSWSLPDMDLQHSLLTLELRDVIWAHIQNLKR